MALRITVAQLFAAKKNDFQHDRYNSQYNY